MNKTTEKILMKCGHSANGTDDKGKPVCVICGGLTPDAEIVCEKEIDLTGRMAKCSDCGKTTPSEKTLPFFKFKPNEEFDDYYDGCYGWG